MPENRRIRSVGALLYNNRAQLLLQQRDLRSDLLFAGCWTTFGGRVEDHEEPDAAIKRELLEEIELQPSLRLWKQYEHQVNHGGSEHTVEQYLYAGRLDCDPRRLNVREGQGAAYFGLQDLENLPVAFGFKDHLRQFLLELGGFPRL